MKLTDCLPLMHVFIHKYKHSHMVAGWSMIKSRTVKLIKETNTYV